MKKWKSFFSFPFLFWTNIGKKGLLLCSFFIPLTLLAATSNSSTLANNRNRKPPTIKPLLIEGSKGVLLEARGAFAVFNPENGKKLSSGKTGKRFYLYPHQEGIKWGEDFLSIFQLQIVPLDTKTTFLIDGIQYRGAIEVYSIESKLHIVNEVDVETFLKSTLRERVSGNLPPVVLNAIAIVARTDAYYTALFNHNAFSHVKAESVGYRGIGLNLQNLAVERAIDHTRHLIMTYQNQPFPATWNEHCAGKTASYPQIFRKKTPAPPGVTSLFAEKDRQDTHWKFVCEVQEIAHIAKLNRITSIDLFADPQSNKVYALRIHDGRHSEEIKFSKLQEILGKDRLRSNDFQATVQGNLVVFEGYGVGMGVGLCLYSATNFSDKGDDAPQILTAFFPHTDLEKMDSYPKTIISSDQETFILPKQRKIKYGSKQLNQ